MSTSASTLLNCAVSMQLVYGAGGVLLRGGKVLVIVEASTNEAYGKRSGMLSVPLGKIDDGEHPSEAAEREFLEETGILVRAVQCLGRLEIPGAIAEMFLMQEQDAGSPRSSRNGEFLDPHWVAIDELLAMPSERVRSPTKPAVLLARDWHTQ